MFDKVVPVAGDILEPDMSLSEEDTQLLIENVSVVFHLAATVRFDAPARCVCVCVCVCVCLCVCMCVCVCVCVCVCGIPDTCVN